MNYTRREFLQLSGLLSVAVLVNPSCTSLIPDYRVFTNDEADCLIPMCEQIVPADDEFGGATQANVINFIDKQLYLRLKKYIPIFRNGVKALQESCEELHGKKFQELTFDEQTMMMTQLQRNKLSEEIWEEGQAGEFFKAVLKYTMMGFYGFPRHGGNKNYMSYRMLRLDVPRVAGQNRYRDIELK